MPRYDAICTACDTTTDFIRPYERRDETPLCPSCNSTMKRVWLTAPAIACHGCPSYEIRRQKSEEIVRRETDKKFNDRNQDEINYAAKHTWKVMDHNDPVLVKEAETRKALGLSETRGFKEVRATA